MVAMYQVCFFPSMCGLMIVFCLSRSDCTIKRNRRSQTATDINTSRIAHLCKHNSRHYSSKENVFQHHFVTYCLTHRIDLPHPGSPTRKGYFPFRSQRLPTTGCYHWHVPSLPGKLWIGVLIRFLSSSKCDTSSDSLDKVSYVSVEGSRDELASDNISESEKTTASHCTSC